MLLSVSGDNLFDGDVGPRQETDEAHDANDEVFPDAERRQTFAVKDGHLKDGRENESQETAADRTDQ